MSKRKAKLKITYKSNYAKVVCPENHTLTMRNNHHTASESSERWCF